MVTSATCPICLRAELLPVIDRPVRSCLWCGIDWHERSGDGHLRKELHPDSQPRVIAEHPIERIVVQRGRMATAQDGRQLLWNGVRPLWAFDTQTGTMFVHA